VNRYRLFPSVEKKGGGKKWPPATKKPGQRTQSDGRPVLKPGNAGFRGTGKGNSQNPADPITHRYTPIWCLKKRAMPQKQKKKKGERQNKPKFRVFPRIKRGGKSGPRPRNDSPRKGGERKKQKKGRRHRSARKKREERGEDTTIQELFRQTFRRQKGGAHSSNGVGRKAIKPSEEDGEKAARVSQTQKRRRGGEKA